MQTFESHFDSWIYRLSSAASLPSDTDEQLLRKAVLILLAGIYTTLGVLWGIAYLSLGLTLAGSFPLAYSALSSVSLYYFFRSKGYKFFCRGQLAMILILPFLLQWSLGGFWNSGAVIVWSILSPIGALMFAGTNRAIPWFSAYVLLMFISGFLNMRSTPQLSLPTFIVVASFVMNIGGVSAIAFFLLKYFVHTRELAMAALDREHKRVRQSLSLAMEVQQNLLPNANPHISGLDIAGSSIYCDETGGDYYDFLDVGRPEEGKIGVVVGDVSDHGIPSALLMATARALIRQRCFQYGDLERVVSDVNRQLTRDVKDSGRFMTLFYAELDSKNKNLSWLNAGHEPAIIYNPNADTVEELAGGGSLPLGIAENSTYSVTRQNILSGQIMVIATDGIWETRNPKGEMFGRQRLYDVIRHKASQSALEIQTAALDALDNFQNGVVAEDDKTLVIIKIEHNA